LLLFKHALWSHKAETLTMIKIYCKNLNFKKIQVKKKIEFFFHGLFTA